MAKKKQQGNGSGTVYPRKNKDGKITSYLGAYYGPDGKRRTVSAKTKSEAKIRLREAMANADKGMVFDAGGLTVAAYLKNWLETIDGTLADNTYQGYVRIVSNHLIPTLGKNLLKNLTPAHVRNLYRSKSDSGLHHAPSSTSTSLYIGHLSRLYTMDSYLATWQRESSRRNWSRRKLSI